MDSSWALGVDIGGSHITAAFVNTSDGSVIQHTINRSAINSAAGAEEIINNWGSVINQSWLMADRHASQIGIAMPGPFDYENGICYIEKQEKYQSLFGLNVKELLATQLGIGAGDIDFINDASGFLKGELFANNFRGSDNCVGITLGTGLGSAQFKAGRLTDAELWRMPFKQGIAEDYLSTRWFVQEYKKRYNKDITGVKDLTVGDVTHTGIFEDFAENLAEFIQGLQVNFECEAVIVGGNITRAYSFFWENTCSILRGKHCPVILSKARHGELSAIIGAAALFKN